MVVWKGDGVGGMGVMVTEELCEKAVEIRILSDTVFSLYIYIYIYTHKYL